MLAEDEENAKNLSRSFTRLCDDVVALRNDIKDDKKWGDDDVTEKIDKLLDGINGLERKLKW